MSAGRHTRLCCLAAAALLGVTPVTAATAQETATPLPAGQKGCLSPPPSAEAGVPWPQQQLQPQRVWPLTTGAGVTVAVVDSGVDGGTPQLAGGRVAEGVDVTTPGRGPANTDCYGHGTFVAGIIAASVSPDTGFAGVAPGATILPIRCASPGEDGAVPVLTSAAMADGIRAAVDGGARVINISASTTTPDPKLADAVRHAADHDVVVVASAANGAKQGDPVTYPAAFPTVIAVGAVDAAGQRAEFSQTGKFLSLVAPGVNVVSVGPRGGGHWQGTGTSYSAPFVAGAAALVRAYHPDLTAEAVRHRLEATADHPAAALPDPGLGWGTVNLVAAVTSVLPEEGTAGRMIDPPPAAPVAAAQAGVNGPLVALVALLLVGSFAFLLGVAVRLIRAGRARNWGKRGAQGAASQVN
ncbi:type VII secretion-associated serine protease mycosin [Amycolatopsis sp. cg5]|uniref:type VII secretion-associated serine protease mycosin n=1 Tax=Amycolatopsis sp. cg5 TaxID=3238802 RepID=UPI003524E6F4